MREREYGSVEVKLHKFLISALGEVEWSDSRSGRFMFMEGAFSTFTVLAPYNAAPHNRYQPHPAEPAQHITCSNTRLVLLKMGIMMPETC